MRVTAKFLEGMVERCNNLGVDIDLCHRNGYYALDTIDGSYNYDAGLSAKECYYYLKGLIKGKADAPNLGVCRP